MRVAVEADECGLRGKVGLGFRVVVDVIGCARSQDFWALVSCSLAS
jgi:hypothetical protein